MRCKHLILSMLTVLLFSSTAGANEAQARELVNSQGCKGCHSIEGSGGTFGPDLTGVGQRLSREQLRTFLLEPHGESPETLMPPFSHLDAAEIEALVAFLAHL